MSYQIDHDYRSHPESCYAEQIKDEDKYLGNQVDIESFLRGMNRVQTKSNKIQNTLPGKIEISPVCDDNVESAYSRYDKPLVKTIEMDRIRMGFPLRDPQCQIFENFEINTRLQAKDNHKAVWQVPIDQSDIFPKNKVERMKNLARRH